MQIIVVVAALVALAVLMFFVGVARAIETPHDDRLEEYLSDHTSVTLSSAVPRRSGSVAASAGGMVEGVDKVLRSLSIGDRLARALRSADLRLTVTEYLAIWLLSILGAVATGYLLSRSWPPSLLMGVLGALVPYLVLRYRRNKRQRAFNDQLANVLMQLSGSLRAGYGLLQAIDFVGREMPAPAGSEFSQVVRDIKLGRPTMLALDDMLQRVESDDLRLIVTAIRIQNETGGNLAEILDTVSETIRERVRIKGELRALTAQQRMAGYVLAGLPIIVFLVLMLLNPTYEARLFTPGPTLCIPLGAITMMIFGFIVIRRVVAIEV